LKPIPVSPPPPSEQKQPPVKITLSGLTDILGEKQALLKAQIPPHPPADPAHEESYILSEGQSESGIKVLAIDQKAGTVKVDNHGTVQTLDFENNGTKLPLASSLPPPPVPVPVAKNPFPANVSNPNPNPGGAITVSPQMPGVNSDQQAVLIELERERLKQAGDDTYKLIPPTQLSEAPQ